ncbi:hypothetical protein [Marinobacter sp.]|uniref:hypothetical protein n=1 Tax=Marinobacter sp. TaxID=50741 RepID=UPI0019EB5F23|nr:hypothetical protein [Marinobacter sp.]MBE0486394.1 hypothetical protein [Marinobacter sp.]
MRVIQRMSICSVVLGLATPAMQVQADAGLNGYWSGGLEHDSNVTVDELNASSGQSDEAWVLGAGLEGVLKPTKALNLTLGYDLSGRRYHNLDQFDQDIHLLSADLSYDFDPVTVGASYHYSYATLDSDRFLDFRRTSLYLGSLIGENVYLMASVQDKSKEFDAGTARDSDIRGGSFDAFFFFNQARSNLILGVDLDDEDARSDAYDNRLIRFRAALVHRFVLAGQDSRFRLSWRYEDQEYDEVVITVEDNRPLNDFLTRDLAERTGQRVDKSRVIEASWRLGLNEVFSLEPRVSYGHYTSTLDSADYDRWVAGVALRAGF